ncbi:MAG: phosphoribosylglycinamide formyltransferase [Gammaproteobacteria bacterium]
MLKLAILISGRGSNMEAVAKACRDGRIAATVAVVISDRDGAGGLGVARELGIETAVVSWKSFPDRAAFERGLIEPIEAHRAEIIVLAGFMRVLSPQFTSRYEGRVLNIHPALLPKHRGLHTHARALEAGDTEHGASVHFATAELDGGPVILQSRIAVRPHETQNDLAGRVLETEHVILPKVIGWLADERLAWRDGKGWLDGRALDAPVIEDFDTAKEH